MNIDERMYKPIICPMIKIVLPNIIGKKIFSFLVSYQFFYYIFILKDIHYVQMSSGL